MSLYDHHLLFYAFKIIFKRRPEDEVTNKRQKLVYIKCKINLIDLIAYKNNGPFSNQLSSLNNVI